MIRHVKTLAQRLAIGSLAFLAALQAQPGPLVRLEKTIELPDVDGRIDHLAVDIKDQRLFVAALGNNTVEVVDVKNGKRLHTITGLHQPQGLAYLPEQNRLFVAGAQDGTVKIFDASSFKLIQTVDLGDDADNIRFDPAASRIYVGYGSGGVGILDASGKKLGHVPLDAHPESFQLEKTGPRIFVNVPKVRKIAVLDRKTSAVVANWETDKASANFPMALDESNKRLFVICRQPALLLAINTDSGALVAKIPTVGDSDDVFFDATRKRIYASGGEGMIAAYQQDDADHYKEIARIATLKGARTSLFVPELDRLFVAARRQGAQSAAIRIYEFSK